MRKKSKNDLVKNASDYRSERINKIFLDKITEFLPQYIFWKNKNSIYLGCNKNFADFVGLDSPSDIVGKRDADLNWQSQGHTAESFMLGDKETLSGNTITNQEEILVLHGKTLTTLVSKLPIVDNNGDAIGIVGYFTDITELRNIEERVKKVELENAIHKAQLEAKEEFAKVANQVAHDIRSPLSGLLMLAKFCREIPEMERIALREAITNIGDIANNLLSAYRSSDPENNGQTQVRQPLLLSVTLLHLLTDKKFQYRELPVKFESDFSQSGQFACIHIEPSAFKRMMSNLMNNAVDALKNNKGRVTLKLDTTDEKVTITVMDNGKGMPQAIIDKIMQNIAVTEGKADGHGIGLTQVRETLQRNEGKMSIVSKHNQGTQIRLEFPRIQTPHWIAEEIILGSEDVIVILDDDSSIHMAWDMRFKSILKQAPNMVVKHFENCYDAIRFIAGFSEEEKRKIYLLTDYELLQQELNGLHVVEETKITRSLLVTSHYANPTVLELAEKMGTKILPKQLASDIPIHINEVNCKNVDLVLVDDDKLFSHSLVNFLLKDKKVDYFEDPNEFKKSLSKYSKDTLIYLDNTYVEADIKGVDIAKALHELGYTRLYLLSGYEFKLGELPEYLITIRKDEVEKLRAVLDQQNC